jgi:hypothetical protein
MKKQTTKETEQINRKEKVKIKRVIQKLNGTNTT